MKDDYLPLPDEAKWRESAMEYERLWNFPGAVASMDGKHLTIVVSLQLSND